MRLRWLSGLRTVVAALALGFAVAGVTVPAGVSSSAAALNAVNPPDFLLVTHPGSGVEAQIEQRSPVTGAVVGVLGRFGLSFTNDGLTQSPDGRQVYVTFSGRKTLRIERIDVVTRARTYVAAGGRPTLSPDGKLLAYESGPYRSDTLAIRDIASGATRTIDLRRLLGPSYDLLPTPITWLADQSAVVIAPFRAPALTRADARHSARGAPGTCSADSARACVIIVQVGHGRNVTAHRLNASLPGRLPIQIEGDGLRPRSVFVISTTDLGNDVQRLDLLSTHARIEPMFSLPDGLVLAFDRTGQQMLYLVGHNPPALWIANVSSGQPADQRLLMPTAELQAAAW